MNLTKENVRRHMAACVPLPSESPAQAVCRILLESCYTQRHIWRAAKCLDAIDREATETERYERLKKHRDAP